MYLEVDTLPHHFLCFSDGLIVTVWSIYMNAYNILN